MRIALSTTALATLVVAGMRPAAAGTVSYAILIGNNAPPSEGVTTPPGAEKPPGAPPAARIRWQGTATRNGFLPRAWPTARDAPGFPIAAAISP